MAVHIKITEQCLEKMKFASIYLLHDKCYETLNPFRIDMLAHAYWLVPVLSGLNRGSIERHCH